jgi:signal transduction histidine kinase
MSRLPGWIQQWVIQITIGFLFGGCVLRMLIQYSEDPQMRLALILLAVWLIVFLTEPLISKRWAVYFYVYLFIQTLLIFTLLRHYPDNDSISILFAGLSMQIMSRMPPKIGIIIIALFTPIIIIGVRPYYDIPKTIPLAVIYTAANAFLGACAYSVRKANEEREKENALLLDLQQANCRLEDSARQAEHLSIARERNRLALELHDSVTQTIFSMTLTTRAAVILLDQDPTRVGSQLDHLDQLVRSALEELKKLVLELKPDAVKPQTLVDLMQTHAARLDGDDLKVTFQVNGKENLSPAEVQCLFRIAQESLNNVIKHAHTSAAWVKLDFDPPSAMEIRDEGAGFDFNQNQPGVGLAGMRERAAGIGWSLEIESIPNQGTVVRVRKQMEEKGDSHGQS